MHPALTAYVRSVTVYDVTSDPGVHIGLPTTGLTLVLPLGEPLDVAWAGRPATRTSSWASVSGLHAGPAAITHGARQRGVQVALHPAAARALLGAAAGELAGELLDLDDVDPGLRDLPERLDDLPPEAHGATVERTLLAALARHDARKPPAEVGRALRRLTVGDRVQAVADEVGYSRRHLSALVREECGLSPKAYQRVARFERSRRHVVASARGWTTLARAAAECGYADQSHLTREWTALAGCTPTEWLRRELPFVQDPDPTPDPPWSHD